MAKKTTSAKVASTASKVLKDGRTSAASKSVAGSALSQREKSNKKKQQYSEELFLNTECDINTFTNGWEHYMTNQDATQVIEEIYSFIYKCRFTKFSIDNIKSL